MVVQFILKRRIKLSIKFDSVDPACFSQDLFGQRALTAPNLKNDIFRGKAACFSDSTRNIFVG